MNKDCLPTIALLFNQSGAAVALFDEDDSSLTRLLAEADRALYQSKHSGRDRISLAE